MITNMITRYTALLTLFTVLAMWTGLSETHPLADNSDASKLNSDYSLPHLINLRKVPSNWQAGEQASLEEGRVVLTSKQNTKGSLWLKQAFNLKDSFTLEWTFRSVGYSGKTDGGISFWFVQDSGIPSDKSLYNGPAKYDGLQLLVDNNGPLGSTLRGQLNDGQKPVEIANIYERSFASCLMGYQDSSVPSTIRVTYDIDDNNLLKVQVDNKVCFQTRKIRFPTGSYHIGVSAENGRVDKNAESFEILKMQLFNGVIEDSLIPNVNAMGQPKMITKIIDQKTGKEKQIEKTVFDADKDKISNYELYKKLDRIEGKILANDINALDGKLNDVIKVQQELLSFMASLTNQRSTKQSTDNKKGVSTEDIIAEDKEEYKDFLSLNQKLEKIVVEQEKYREAAKRHGQGGPQVDEIARKLMIWLLPLIFIMLIMAYYTFKIRQEIIKTKLL
ncbi:Emp47p [Saccharomyces eubayanus]|uniref:Emp47p n=1 Tax=Saccharomyces eubayanus TaxID=1080349 RepID=UPI0006C27791|nr:EMP47-like protein [Saccharomyces eubayanus]KOG99775.1 EMP47-like protein [Saccharomyces eubayanus]